MFCVPERMAMHDPLTDLPNRRMFEERLIATMEEARLTRTTVACLVIDVDNFKTINDTLGHTAGDQLLRALAVRLFLVHEFARHPRRGREAMSLPRCWPALPTSTISALLPVR